MFSQFTNILEITYYITYISEQIMTKQLDKINYFTTYVYKYNVSVT